MKVADVAKRLEISTATVYQIIAIGKLRCSRYGIGRGTIRISEEQLAEYIESASDPDPDRGRVFKHMV